MKPTQLTTIRRRLTTRASSRSDFIASQQVASTGPLVGAALFCSNDNNYGLLPGICRNLSARLPPPSNRTSEPSRVPDAGQHKRQRSGAPVLRVLREGG